MDVPFLQDLYAAIARALPRGLRGYLDPTLAVLAAGVIGLVLRLTLFRWLRRVATWNKIPYDDIIIEGLTRRVVAWSVLGTLYMQCERLPWRPKSIATAQNMVAALLIMSVTLVLVRMLSAIIQAYGTTSAAGVGGTTLMRYLSTVMVLFLGVVSVLALFGISVVPAITALGVGGLAVALAFQDTLANVFSGLNLTLARQLRVGDYVQLNEDTEGFVVDIGWRATTLRTLVGLQIFIPNKRLAEAVMTNYTRDPGMAVELEFRVPLDCDPERVEAMVVDEMRQAAVELPGLRSDEPALLRFRAFGPSALDLKAIVWILNFQDRLFLRHELMKRLHRRLRDEKIVVPVPQQQVQMATPGAPPRDMQVGS